MSIPIWGSLKHNVGIEKIDKQTIRKRIIRYKDKTKLKVQWQLLYHIRCRYLDKTNNYHYILHYKCQALRYYIWRWYRHRRLQYCHSVAVSENSVTIVTSDEPSDSTTVRAGPNDSATLMRTENSLTYMQKEISDCHLKLGV